jgi:hypothetical protein
MKRALLLTLLVFSIAGAEGKPIVANRRDADCSTRDACAPRSQVPGSRFQIPSSKATRAIVGEAANQGYRGMLAVAGAIRNRGTLKGVYGLKNPIADKQPKWVWTQARQAWSESRTNDITGGATHWENVKAFGVPKWARGMHKTVRVKDHQFFKE